MKPGQEEIYYITASTRDEALQSPYLEAFSEKDYEVLIMLDEVDDFIMGNLHEYKGKKLKSAIKGDVSLDKSDETDREKAKEKFRKLLDYIKDRLKDEVKEVRLSGRLKDSACCLVTDEGGMDPKMESILRAMGQDLPANKRILEINPSHPVFEAMSVLLDKDGANPVLREYTDLLYNEALLLEGSKPKDPASFAKVISKLILENTKQFKG
jgi:molecular chaperone HtpG